MQDMCANRTLSKSGNSHALLQLCKNSMHNHTWARATIISKQNVYNFKSSRKTTWIISPLPWLNLDETNGNMWERRTPQTFLGPRRKRKITTITCSKLILPIKLNKLATKKYMKTYTFVVFCWLKITTFLLRRCWDAIWKGLRKWS